MLHRRLRHWGRRTGKRGLQRQLRMWEAMTMHVLMLRRNSKLRPVPRVLRRKLSLVCRMCSTRLFLSNAICLCLCRELRFAIFGCFRFARCPPFRHAL